MLEKNLQDILNAGIGLFKEGEKNFQAALEAVGKTFEELKQRGAADGSESAQKVREALENTIRGVKDVSTQAEQNFNKILAEAEKNYAQLLEQVQGVIGDERIKDVNARFEELAKFVKEKADDVTAQAQGFADSVKETASKATKPKAPGGEA